LVASPVASPQAPLQGHVDFWKGLIHKVGLEITPLLPTLLSLTQNLYISGILKEGNGEIRAILLRIARFLDFLHHPVF
jgi:hypothetical protein